MTGANPSQPITILEEEHKVILSNLGRLEEVAKRLQSSARPGTVLDELRTISQSLLDAESHHKREEDALFPRLEERGIRGPPSMMRLEHNELRKRKKALKDLVEGASSLDEADFSRQVIGLADFIVPTLRNHIFKEDDVLYPMALQTIPNDEWSRIRSEFDKIGYCSFTPKHVLG